MHELSCLEQEVVIETVAMALEQAAIGGEDEDLLARPILFRLPERLELVRARFYPLVVLIARCLLLFMLLKLHISESLCQVKMDLVDVLDRAGVLHVGVLGVQLVHCVEDQVKEVPVVGRVDTGPTRGRCSRRHVHEGLHHSANEPLSIRGDSNQAEVIR